MIINDFEEIISRKKWQSLCVSIYNEFNKLKDYWFKDQIQRCSVSISNNIAEWFERKSNNEFKYFLYVAKWSCWELRSMLNLAKNLWYLEQETYSDFYKQAKEISSLIGWLIRSLK